MLHTLEEHLSPKIVGQKSAGLSWLNANNFLVPDSLTLSTKAMTIHLKENGLWERAIAGGDRHLSDAIRNAPMPDLIQSKLQSTVWKLGEVLAVRSSAVDEDGRVQSFAGQYESFLGVKHKSGLIDAVKACWASYFSSNAILYRGSQRFKPSGMAVLIQRQLVPSHAGVCFSINPMTGSWRELVIESYPGLGSDVASGNILPDYYRLERPARLVPIGLRFQLRGQLKVLEQECKSSMVLPKQMLARIKTLVLRLERLCGQAQDIEWGIEEGKVFFLQHRPITAHAKLQKKKTLWSQAFIGERWAEPASPLGWSLIADILTHFIEYPVVSKKYFGGDPAMKKHRHAPYLNLSPFRYLLFKWPGSPPPQFMLELLPASEARQWRQRFAVLPNLGFYRAIIEETVVEKRWQRFSWNPLSNWIHWKNYDLELKRFLSMENTGHEDLNELWDKHLMHKAMARKYVGIHICSLLFANIGYEVSNWILKRKLNTEQLHHLLRSYRTTPTIFVNQALWELEKGYLPLDDFINQYGHRAPNSWELFSKRWCEDVNQILDLKRLMQTQAEPLILEKKSLEQSKLIMGKLNVFEEWWVRDVQRYLYLREAQRFSFDGLLWSWKSVLLEISKIVGIDVRWLTAKELEQLVFCITAEQPVEERWTQTIKERKDDWEKERLAWYRGERPDYVLEQNEIDVDPNKKRLNGIGISPGIVRGPARVLSHINQAQLLQPGEILVVRSTDPAWTPLFVPAKGVVLELGGMLSHGAIVARECRTPAVSGIKNATRIINDGEMIEIDGQRGWVIVNSS